MFNKVVPLLLCLLFSNIKGDIVGEYRLTGLNIVDYDLTKANIIYIGSLCFSDKLLKIISDKINHHSSIKYVITFNKLPDTYLKLMKELIIPCSWKNNEILYIYEK